MAGSAHTCVSGSPGPLQPSRRQNLKNAKRYRPGVAIRARSVLQVRSAFSGEAYTAASLTAGGPPVQWTSRHSLVQGAAFGRDDPGLSGGGLPTRLCLVWATQRALHSSGIRYPGCCDRTAAVPASAYMHSPLFEGSRYRSTPVFARPVEGPLVAIHYTGFVTAWWRRWRRAQRVH